MKPNKRELAAADLAKLPDKQKVFRDKNITKKRSSERELEGSARFKLVGGPYHDMTVRLYAPFDDLVFPSGETYQLHPPVSQRTDRWVYVHVDKKDSGGNNEQ